METYRSPIHLIAFLGSLLGALIALEVAAFAQGLLPNLQALPARNITLSSGLLSFDTTSWNSGLGRLELVAANGNNKSKKQKVYQRVYYSNGTYYDNLAGDFIWHKQHNHFHFEEYARYTLLPAGAPTTSRRTSSKTTFCVMDTDRITSTQAPVYTTCGSAKQGMSVGWGDTYKSFLSGQSIYVGGLPSGTYQLIIEIDPQRRLLETNETDNSSCVLLDLYLDTTPQTFTVLNDSGC